MSKVKIIHVGLGQWGSNWVAETNIANHPGYCGPAARRVMPPA